MKHIFKTAAAIVMMAAVLTACDDQVNVSDNAKVAPLPQQKILVLFLTPAVTYSLAKTSPCTEILPISFTTTSVSRVVSLSLFRMEL